MGNFWTCPDIYFSNLICDSRIQSCLGYEVLFGHILIIFVESAVVSRWKIDKKFVKSLLQTPKNE